MRAMLMTNICSLQETDQPLRPAELTRPEPGDREVLVRISACGVCHTELDEIEGRTPPPTLPVVPGHQIVGRVERMGKDSTTFDIGERVGVGWIHSACGRCEHCLRGEENLCRDFKATGRDVHGGYAEYLTAPEEFAVPIPECFSDSEAAPLLCAGAIGYRSVRLTGLEDGQRLGLTGFGASAHLVLKMVRHRFPNSEVFVFARSEAERAFARDLGAVWSGGTEEDSPRKLHAMIDTTPAWRPVVEALKNLQSGGRLVINAIRKEEGDKSVLMELSYPAHLWMEKEIKSVANVSRRDIVEFLRLASDIPLRPEVQTFALEEANRALVELKGRKIRGAKVLLV